VGSEMCIRDRLIAYQEIEGKEVSVYDAMGIVGNLLRSERGVDPSEKLLATLAVIFDVSPSEIKGKTRKASAVLARQLGMYFAKKYLKMSNEMISRLFDRSPSVVSTTVRRASDKINKNPLLEGYVRRILSHMSPAIGREF
jgi:chromosomal replication initiation ATPase DnaA